MRNTRFEVGERMRRLVSGWLLLACMLGGVAASAQNTRVYQSREKSQAEKEAERLVSLSADRLIDLLSSEPGLLLQVKKDFVRQAYEQGRILDESDLTDDALFHLIREDASLRALVTREVSDRNYIRPKPTQAELERQRLQKLFWEREGRDLSKLPPEAPSAGPKAGVSQESDYWARHELQDTALPPLQPPKEGGDNKDSPYFTTPDGQVVPRSQFNRAQLDNGYWDFPLDMGTGGGGMQRAQPSQMSELMAASQSSGARSKYGETNDYADPDEQDPLSGGQDPLMMGEAAPQRRTSSAPIILGNAGGGGSGSGGYGMRGNYGMTPSEPQVTRDIYGNRIRPQAREASQPMVRHTANPYFNVPSLYDLYSQVQRKAAPLQRFGTDIFTNGTGNYATFPMDVPVGPEYVIGPGDALAVNVWGGVAQRFPATVDREGRISLPEVGTIEVAGHSMAEVTHLVQAALRTQYRGVTADISLARLRNVRVYVVGNVKYPGAYDISALSTPLNAIYEAGGPTAQGSMRHIRHMRGKQVIGDYDAYELILHGVNSDVKSLQPGDSIVVTELGTQVAVEGMVRRPAIYELRGEKTLADVLELAGGVMSNGSLRHIDVDRLEAHEKRTMVSLDLPENNNDGAVNAKLADFKVQDGDHIRIAPIVSYAEKTVYLDGHLFRPGKYAWKEGMKVSDVIRSYTDLLPEPYMRHAEIIRLNPPNFAPQVIGFNLGDALAKKDDLALQPFDTVRVFSRYDFEDQPIVTVGGEVREPGDHITNGATRLSDAVYLAGGLTPDASTGEVQIYRKTQDAKLRVVSVDLGRALNGDPTQNVLLQPKDRIIIHKDQAKIDPPTVKVEGEVGRPGKYVLSAGMTAAQAIELAGGLKRSADKQMADLVRVGGEERVTGERQELELAKVMTGEGDIPLKDGDVLSVRQISGWEDRGATITLRGEVAHPGTYGIRPGEKLSSILRRAGGLTGEAYAYGAVLERQQIRELEEQSRMEMIRRVERAGDALRTMPDNPIDPYHPYTKNAAIAQWEVTLEKLKATPPAGRLVIHVSTDIKRWENSSADVEARAGDVLIIPKKPNFVVVTGAVYSPNAVSYRPGKSAEWYLQQGGGATQQAKKGATFVVRADGTVIAGGSGLFGSGLHGASLKPGDTVVVPEKAIGGPAPWQLIFQSVQSATSIAFAASYLIK